MCKSRFIDGAIEVENAYNEAHPSAGALEAMARHDIAETTHTFMCDVPGEQVAGRLVSHYEMTVPEAASVVRRFSGRYRPPGPLRW